MPFNLTIDFVKLFQNQSFSEEPFYFHTFINHPSVKVRYIFFQQNVPFSQKKLFSLKQCQKNNFIVQCIQIEHNSMIQIKFQSRLQILSIEYQTKQKQDKVKLFSLVNPTKKQFALIYTQLNPIFLEQIPSNFTIQRQSYYFLFYFTNENIRVYLQHNIPFLFGFKLNNQLYSLNSYGLIQIQFINNSLLFIPQDWTLFNTSVNYLLRNKNKEFQNMFYIGYYNQTIINKNQIKYMIKNDYCIQNCNQDNQENINKGYKQFQGLNIPTIISIIIFCFIIVLISFMLLVYYCKRKKLEINHGETEVKIVKIVKSVQQIKKEYNLECIICLDKLTQSTIKLFPCKHIMFHKSCIKQWVQKKKQCPLCRSFIQQMQQF